MRVVAVEMVKKGSIQDIFYLEVALTGLEWSR
jgi:hypothetical protein